MDSFRSRTSHRARVWNGYLFTLEDFALSPYMIVLAPRPKHTALELSLPNSLTSLDIKEFLCLVL